jgi:hypothetical protein
MSAINSSLEIPWWKELLLGPETKGKRLTADVEVVKVAAQPAT